MLVITQKVTLDRTWTPIDVSTADIEIIARDKYPTGMIDLDASMGFFCRSDFGDGYGGEFKEVDNKLLGIPLKTDADLEELIRGVLSHGH